MNTTKNKSLVLVVDDIPENIDNLGSILAKDYNIKVALNGKKALMIARSEHRPDIILLDIMMPGMDGYEVCRELKTDPKTESIPIIFVTGKTDEEDEARGFAIGAVDYITKPYNPPIVLARIKTQLSLKKNLAKLQTAYTVIERQKKIMEDELNAGRKIQKSFFPESLPAIEKWEIETYFQPARQVSGDFYDAFVMEKNGSLNFIIADVCDKGVGAALFMGLFRSLIRVFSELHYGVGNTKVVSDCIQDDAGTDIHPFLENVISQINNYIAITHSDVNMFATLFWGILNPADGELYYINAGHESAVIVGPHGIKTQLPPTGPAVGLMPDLEFKIKQAKINPGESIIAFTDGITESRNKSDELYGVDNFINLLNQLPAQSAKEMINGITKSVDDHMSKNEPFDDITLMVIHHA